MTDTEFIDKAQGCRTAQDYQATFDVESLTDKQLRWLTGFLDGSSRIINRAQHDYIKSVGRPVT